MSRWWPERLVLTLGDESASGGGASALLDEADRMLDRLQPRRGTRWLCVLAGEGVRYRLVPWADALTSLSQRRRLAEHCFHEAYGEVARGWTVSVGPARYGAAALACAIDTALLAGLEARATARSLVLDGVRPLLTHALDGVRRRIARPLHWFVVMRGRRVTLLLRSPTEALAVRQLPWGGSGLAELLDREWFALGMTAPRCPVFVVGGPVVAEGWEVVDLTPAQSADAGRMDVGAMEAA
ncbi:MAG TPA: hypothetical protein VLI72_10575 [Methylibium sp.]|nr:hypothetical protein [Methylibium sp.]